METFFISYSFADTSWALWIAWQLEEARYTTIRGELIPGANFIEEMETIKEAEQIIIVLSPDYLNSAYTTKILSEFLDTVEPGKLLPVRVREFEPKGPLGTLAYIDLIGLDEVDARAALLEGVRLEAHLSKYQTNKQHSQSYQPRYPGNLSNNKNDMLFSDF